MPIVADGVTIRTCNGVTADNVNISSVDADGVNVYSKLCAPTNFTASDNDSTICGMIRYTWAETEGAVYDLYEGNTLLDSDVHAGHAHDFGGVHSGTYKVKTGNYFSNEDAGSSAACPPDFVWGELSYEGDNATWIHTVEDTSTGEKADAYYSEDLHFKGWTFKGQEAWGPREVEGPCGESYYWVAADSSTVTLCGVDAQTRYIDTSGDVSGTIEAGSWSAGG